jgi:hypothetical protein
MFYFLFNPYIYTFLVYIIFANIQLKSTDIAIFFSGDATWYPVVIFFQILKPSDAEFVALGTCENTFSHSYGSRRYSKIRGVQTPALRRVNAVEIASLFAR